MDPVWTQLPSELSDHICNQLPKVRSIDKALKRELCSQRYLYAKFINRYIELFSYPGQHWYHALRVELGGDPTDVWNNLTPEERWELYHTV